MKYTLLFSLLFLYIFSYACDCPSRNFKLSFIEAESVFSAKVIKVHYSDSSSYLIEVEPIEVYKGKSSNNLTVYSFHEDNEEGQSSCDIYINEGETWLFFSEVGLGACSSSKEFYGFSDEYEKFVRSKPKIEDIINEIVFDGFGLDNGREVFSKLDSNHRTLIFRDKIIKEPILTHGLVIINNDGSIEEIRYFEDSYSKLIENKIKNMTLPIGLKDGFKVRYHVLMDIIIAPEKDKKD